MAQNSATSNTMWPPRRIVLATLVVLAIAIAFWLLIAFRDVLFSLFIAIVLSTAFEPLIDRLARFGLPRAFSIVLISLIFILLVVIAIVAIIPLISNQWFTLTVLMQQGYENFRNLLMDSGSILLYRIGQQLPSYMPNTPPPPPGPEAGQPALDMFQRTLTMAGSIFNSLILGISVLLLSGLWILEGETATRFLLMVFPAQRREGIQNFIGEVKQKIGAYTRGLGLLSLIIGVMAGVAYMIIGLPNVIFLAVFAGLMEIVPLVGPLLGAVPAVLVAASFSPDKIIWVIIATIVIQASENNFVVPRVMDREVGVNPVAGLLAFLAFGSIFGLFGALLAIPLAAVIQLILNRFIFKENPMEQSPPTGRSTISTLRYEAQNLVMDVRKQVRDKDAELTAREDSIEDSMEAIAADLDSILAMSEDEENGSQNGNSSSGSNGKRAP